MDLEVRVQVAMLQWIKRLIRTPQSNVADSFGFILRSNDIPLLLRYKSLPASKDWEAVPFYRQMNNLWHSVHAFEPTCEAEVRREVLWCNQRIIMAAVPMKWRKWEDAGILTVNDVCHESEDRNFAVRCSFLDAPTETVYPTCLAKLGGPS